MATSRRPTRTRTMRTPAVICLLIFASPSQAASCNDLVNLKLPDTEIKSATLIAAGEHTGPDGTKRPDLPAFCRVIASVKSAPDSDIGVEVWLPADRWKGVFHGNGSGGFGGSLA